MLRLSRESHLLGESTSFQDPMEGVLDHGVTGGAKPRGGHQ